LVEALDQRIVVDSYPVRFTGLRMPNSTLESAPKRKRRVDPRTPSRGRGILRYEALLDAAEALLATENPDTIGLYQMAERAGVPPASVYHFFPTKEAAFVALAERYLTGIKECLGAPIEARELQSWQDLLRIDARRSMAFHNSHPPMLKLLYGGYGGVEARNIDMLYVANIATAHYNRLNRIFHMPHLRNPAKIFEIRISILDAIWTISYRRHGCITEEYFREVYQACVSYARLYLPEYVERRDSLIEAAERGEKISLPIDENIDPAPPRRGRPRKSGL
jgi:AcrR family transcriptional regulator